MRAINHFAREDSRLAVNVQYLGERGRLLHSETPACLNEGIADRRRDVQKADPPGEKRLNRHLIRGVKNSGCATAFCQGLPREAQRGEAHLIISTAIGLFIGGFIAANLSRTFSDERAVIYGLGVWALSALITMAIALSSIMSGLGSAAQTAGNVAGGTLQFLGSTAQGIASGGAQMAQGASPEVMRRLEQALTGGQPGQVNPQGAQQIMSILQNAIQQGELNQQQRQQLETAVAQTFNIPPEQARQRVEQVQSQVQQAVGEVRETAREVADATLTAVATTAYWSFAAILIGAIAALLGARYGALDEQDLPRFARLRLTRTVERT